MNAASLIARLREQRDSWFVLREAATDRPELAVCLRRPAAADFVGLRAEDGGISREKLVETVCSSAVAWRGFTEAELLGAAVGSADPLPFDADVWAESVRDDAEWLAACVAHVVEQLTQHSSLAEDRRKA